MKKSVEVKILELLCLKWSFGAIIQYFRSKKIKLSKSSISHIKKKHLNDKENVPPRRKSVSKTGRPPALNKREISNLRKGVLSENPKTQVALATKYKVVQSTISKYITKKLGFRRRKKKEVHFLTEKQKKNVGSKVLAC